MERFRLASVRELDDFVERYPDVVIVDVRPKEEYQISHIRYAINIPYEEEVKWNLPGKKEIIVYCERGATSLAAARKLWRQGYRVTSVAGGILEYRGRNLVFSR
ncbi:MAG: rhodanese-like domain-containing protein [Clostridia bacterium]|nr:rhodanese-like domain-containing protein [Clostridia bacterium]NCC43276.1 rhodanese-like domain-containing protein [Clostridia bacterium]